MQKSSSKCCSKTTKGFSPIVDTSGSEEEAARKRSGTGKPLDGEGRDDVKLFFLEAGQSVLTSCAGSRLGKKGWAMINRGKHRNMVVCAIGHKLILYAFHIMRGGPTPNRDSKNLDPFREAATRLIVERLTWSSQASPFQSGRTVRVAGSMRRSSAASIW